MNPISVLILVLIVVAAIFVITYVAHDRGSSMCSGCHGDMYYQAAQYDYENQTVVSAFGNVWSNLYYAITQCNAFIEYSTPYRDDIDNYNLLLGEVYALRAFAHMELFELFGPVIHTKADLSKSAIAYRTAYNNVSHDLIQEKPSWKMPPMT